MCVDCVLLSCDLLCLVVISLPFWFVFLYMFVSLYDRLF